MRLYLGVRIAERKQRVGDERIQQVFERFRSEMKRGSDPAGETVQALARQSMSLVREFTGANPEIEKSLNTTYREEPNFLNQFRYNVDGKLFDYIRQASEAARKRGGI